MEELIALLLSSPAVRALLEGVVIKVVAEVMHRRAVDPDYLKKSDEVFAKLATASTEEEKADADRALAELLSR